MGDSRSLSYDSVHLNSNITTPSVYMWFNSVSYEFSCSFPCHVAVEVNNFCSAIALPSSNVQAGCVVNIWRQHAVLEHLLGLREGIKVTNHNAGLRRSNNWFEQSTLYLLPLLATHFLPSFVDQQGILFALRPISILEVGSYEGGSTIWFLRYLLSHPDSVIVCVDAWTDTQSQDPDVNMHYNGSATPSDDTFRIFQSNMKLTNLSHHVRSMRGDSLSVLSSLVASNDIMFDIAYIDGSHDTFDVMGDVILAWRLLKVGGIMILDDARWVTPLQTIDYSYDDNCIGIKASHHLYLMYALQAVLGSAGHVEVLHCDSKSSPQVVVRKHKERFKLLPTIQDL